MNDTPAGRAIAIIREDEKLAELDKALPDHMTAERFARLAVTMFQKPELRECSAASIIGSTFEAAQLGLYLDGVLGHAYLVPFRNKGKKEATLIIGYRGYIYMALRTGFINHINAAVVYEGDEFDYELGGTPRLHHKPTREADARGDVTAAYDVMTYKTGIRSFEIMERVDLAAIEKRALSNKRGWSPWKHPEDKKEMQKKSVLRKHQKWAGLSADLTYYAVKDEYHEAGIQLPAEDRSAFLEKMASPEVKQVESTSGLSKEDRKAMEQEYRSLCPAGLGTLERLSDGQLADTVEILRQKSDEGR